MLPGLVGTGFFSSAAGGGGPETSYVNEGGTGNRTGIITVTYEVLNPVGVANWSHLVDGSFADVGWWATDSGDGSERIIFDFGSPKVIDAFKWYQDVNASHGTWRFEGSADGSTWTQIGSDFTLSGSSAGTEHAFPKPTGYRYYCIHHMSGGRTDVPYLREIEFKIA